MSPCYRDDPAQAELRDELGLTECPDALPDPDPPDAGQPAGEAADVIRDTGA